MSGPVFNKVRNGFYLDSIALMRISRKLEAHAGVEVAALMIGTPANREILSGVGLLTNEGREATPGDLIIAVRTQGPGGLEKVLAEAEMLLAAPFDREEQSGEWRPKMLATATEALPGANLALISVPGEYAPEEARKALHAGLHVMIFSDNVPLEDEFALKAEGRTRGLLVMGADCGTALINGVPLGFANVVPRGPVGIVAASGTGLQEVSSLIARMGGGISHGIGTGGRDLSETVGGIATLMAIDALDEDPATRHITLISKPPAPEVANLVLERVARSAKPFTVCFLGQRPLKLPPNAKQVRTLQEAAEHSLGGKIPRWVTPKPLPARRGWLRGLFVGGTLCAEAQVILQSAGRKLASNAPLPGVDFISQDMAPGQVVGHQMWDLGADEFTVGRPHPMIDPAPRHALLQKTLAEPEVAGVLLDVVLGTGAHENPAEGLAAIVRDCGRHGPPVIASVCGTVDDPQNYDRQVAILSEAGIVIAPSNAAAAELALGLLAGDVAS